MGDYLPADATLNRFFALHVVALPLVLLLLVVLHIGALHEVGSNNPDGVEIKKKKKRERHAARRHRVPSVLHGQGSVRHRFLPAPLRVHHLLSADRSAAGSSSTTTSFPANNLVTPEHIKPVWYFTPFYAMLRVIPAKRRVSS